MSDSLVSEMGNVEELDTVVSIADIITITQRTSYLQPIEDQKGCVNIKVGGQIILPTGPMFEGETGLVFYLHLLSNFIPNGIIPDHVIDPMTRVESGRLFNEYWLKLQRLESWGEGNRVNRAEHNQRAIREYSRRIMMRLQSRFDMIGWVNTVDIQLLAPNLMKRVKQIRDGLKDEIERWDGKA